MRCCRHKHVQLHDLELAHTRRASSNRGGGINLGKGGNMTDEEQQAVDQGNRLLILEGQMEAVKEAIAEMSIQVMGGPGRTGVYESLRNVETTIERWIGESRGARIERETAEAENDRKRAAFHRKVGTLLAIITALLFILNSLITYHKISIGEIEITLPAVPKIVHDVPIFLARISQDSISMN